MLRIKYKPNKINYRVHFFFFLKDKYCWFDRMIPINSIIRWYIISEMYLFGDNKKITIRTDYNILTIGLL